MGKKTRKTRWRALDIADDHSDSEESNTNSSAVSSRYSRSNSNYSTKYSYSSQSTPARRCYNQYDGSTKSTRSSSTTSENKITFNEDEYTRITTPRQDVLFKKGYLNKPKSFQMQTSTGNSTISTGNSTENGTPDHQSTDLDYESQFVFPNGFVDQNGIYYVNSYEPYPLMLFNPPTYFNEFSNSKTKRYSTGSLSESTSPNNEEVTSQDMSQSGGEASNGGMSDNSAGPPVYNMIYPGYYVNGSCTPNDLANEEHHHHQPSISPDDQPQPQQQQQQQQPVKKLKKRRERVSSKTVPGDSSEFTDENSSDERCLQQHCPTAEGGTAAAAGDSIVTDTNNPTSINKNKNDISTNAETAVTDKKLESSTHPAVVEDDSKKTESSPHHQEGHQQQEQQFSLHPNAREFVPRCQQQPVVPAPPPAHIKMMPPNFVPIPLMPIGDFNGQNFAPHPAFIPPGIPINFIPHVGQKMFVGYPAVAAPPPVILEAKIEEKPDQSDNNNNNDGAKENDNAATPTHTPVAEDGAKLVPAVRGSTKTIDIATVVSKLEAVQLQERQNGGGGGGGGAELAQSRKVAPAPAPRFRQNFNRSFGNNNNNHSGKLRDVRNGQGGPTNHQSPQSGSFEKRNWKNNSNTYRASPKRVTTAPPTTAQIKQPPPAPPAQPQPQPEAVLAKKPCVPESPKPKAANQWIAVASRKKKKNKGTGEEVENDEPATIVAEDCSSSDLYESYDVTQLVDVVVVPPPAEPVAEEKKIEEILCTLARNEPSQPKAQTAVDIPEVSAIEKDLIAKSEEDVAAIAVAQETRKKSKKGAQKPLTKKVMITDVFDDLSASPAEPSKPAPAKKQELPAKQKETPVVEKKAKKPKKKKPTAVSGNNNNDNDGPNASLETSTETLLLDENAISSDKTTEEISQELDKLIQKGMYGSLQDKIRSIEENEAVDFLKAFGTETVAAAAAATPPLSKDKLLKAPDFNRIFQSTRQLLKPNMTLPIRPLDLF